MPISAGERKTMHTRRDFGKIALASLPIARAFGAINSRIGGVQVGAITYSFGSMPLDDVIKAYVDIGLGEMELMSNTLETAAGAPSAAPPAGRGGARGNAPGPARQEVRPPMTEAQIAEARSQPRNMELRNWR